MKWKLYLLLPLVLALHGCGDVEWLPDAAEPQQFSFSGMKNVELKQSVTSQAVTVTGNKIAAPITITNGEYAIGGTGGDGQFTSRPGKVSAGQTVTVRHTSAADHSTAVSTLVTIGGVSAVFTSVTRQLTDPTGTFVMSAPAEFILGPEDQTTVTGDLSVELHNISTASYYARIDFVALDAAGTTVYAGSEESPLPYDPGETSIFPAPVSVAAAEYARIARWRVTAITRVDVDGGS